MRSRLASGLLVAIVILITGCSSTPGWEDMSQSEIAQWKGGGFDAKHAQQWKAEGFTAEQAAQWSAARFSLDEAHSWNRESFTAAQAANWKQGGFDLREAKGARKKGLAPIQQEQSVSEGTAPGAAAANPEALEDSASATAVDSAADIIEDEIDTASFAN